MLAPERFLVILGASVATLVCAQVLARALALSALFAIPTLAICISLILFMRYRKDSAALDRVAATRVFKDAAKAAETAEAVVAALTEERRSRDGDLAQAVARYRLLQDELEHRQAASLDEVARDHEAETEQLNERRRKIDLDEGNGVAAIHRGSGSQVRDFQQQLAAIPNQEQGDLNKTLAAAQQQHVSNVLKRATISSAEIPGVGVALKARLHGANINTAADIHSQGSVRHVSGFGSVKASDVWDWRCGIEQKARTSMPTRLDRGTQDSIRSKYVTLRHSIEQGLDRARQQNTSEIATLRRQVAQARDVLKLDEQQRKATIESEEKAVKSQLAPEFLKLQKELTGATSSIQKQISQIDKQRRDALTEAFSRQWRHEMARRKLADFDAVRFRGYLRRLTTM